MNRSTDSASGAVREFLAFCRSRLSDIFQLTSAEQKAVVAVLALLLLGSLVRYGRFFINLLNQ